MFVELPYSKDVDVTKLQESLDSAVSCMWLLAISELIIEERQLSIPIEDVATRVVAMAWLPCVDHRLRLDNEALQDCLAELGYALGTNTTVSNVEQRIQKCWTQTIASAIEVFVRRFPIDFLSPWRKRQGKEYRYSAYDECIYEIDEVGKHDYEIYVSKKWAQYLSDNILILRHFCSGTIRLNLLKKNFTSDMNQNLKIKKLIFNDVVHIIGESLYDPKQAPLFCFINNCRYYKFVCEAFENGTNEPVYILRTMDESPRNIVFPKSLFEEGGNAFDPLN